MIELGGRAGSDGGDPARACVPEALAALDGLGLGGYRLKLAGVRPCAYVEQVRFSLYLVDRDGRETVSAPFAGIYSAGRPWDGIAGWVDGAYHSPVRTAAGAPVNLEEDGLDRQFFGVLGRLIPPDGRLMVAYEAFFAETPAMGETRVGLAQGIPPLVTPLGHLLFCAGCWMGIRDWYIPEGGREGHRKLQGNRALNDTHRRKGAQKAMAEVEAFLDGLGVPSGDVLLHAAYRRSKEILAALRG